jgi:hypothetical protein
LYVAVWVERERCGHQSTHATRERHERIENPKAELARASQNHQRKSVGSEEPELCMLPH